MYPVSFDNPNGRARPQRAANRNVAQTSDGAPQDPRITVFPEEDRLLVVECRTDDRWRVVLCTGLDDLDDALDTVRTLRRAEGTDEVSLTIEVSGERGRESRREVVRFAKETGAEAPATLTAGVAGMTLSNMPSVEMQAMEAAFAAVSPAFKMPDITYDDMILPAGAATPSAVNDTSEIAEALAADEIALSSLAWEDEVIQTHSPAKLHKTRVTSDDIPDFLKVQPVEISEDDQPDETEDSLLGVEVADEKPEETSDEDAAETPDIPFPASSDPFAAVRFGPRRRTPQSFASNSSRHNWIDDLLNNSGPIMTHSSRGDMASHGDMAMYEDEEEGDDEFTTRLESPMFARENGVTAKVLVFAGTVALLILGGALAELLAVDITSSANAQTHFLDTGF